MAMDYSMLGKRIRRARKELSLTQEDLATLCGVSACFIGLIERGRRRASVETLLRISCSLNTSMDHLLADSHFEPHPMCAKPKYQEGYGPVN